MEIDQRVWARAVVAADQAAHPGRVETDQFGSLLGRIASRNQPQDVPAARFFGISTATVPVGQFIHREMGLELKSFSCHKRLSYQI